MYNEKEAMEIVDRICNTEPKDCRSLNKTKEARKLMNFANVPKDAKIQEIPLDWNRQVNILFLIPDDENYYSLFAGIGNDGNFCFELSIEGLNLGKDFQFYDEPKMLSFDYFIMDDRRLGVIENNISNLLFVLPVRIGDTVSLTVPEIKKRNVSGFIINGLMEVAACLEDKDGKISFILINDYGKTWWKEAEE